MKLNFPSNLKCHSYIFSTPKTLNGMDETQLSFELKVSLIHLLHPKTQDGMDETPLFFELKVSFIHVLHPANSKWNGWNSTLLRTRSVIHTSCTPQNSRWNGWNSNFPSNLKCHSYIFCIPKTENGMDETQLFFELKVSVLHLVHPQNSRWNGWNSTSLRT